MPAERDATDKQLAAFVAAATTALGPITKAAVSRGTGFSGDRVQRSLSGRHEPSRAFVAALERFLRLDPGELSVHLGYLPLDAVPTVPVAIAASPLDATSQRQLASLYRRFTEDGVDAHEGDVSDA